MRFLKTALWSWIGLSILCVPFFAGIQGWPMGAVNGAMAALGLGLTIAGLGTWWVARVARRMRVLDGSVDGERLLHQGAGNHFLNGEGRGGWLILTERSIVWRTHGVNVQNAPLRIALADVRSVAPSHTFGLFPTGLRVKTTGGREERFVVYGREDWIRAIDAAAPVSASDPGRPLRT